jgi:hypothetical protein
MKKTAKTTRNLAVILSVLTDDQVLGMEKMKYVRGGDGEGTPIIIPPPIKI